MKHVTWQRYNKISRQGDSSGTIRCHCKVGIFTQVGRDKTERKGKFVSRIQNSESIREKRRHHSFVK